MHIFVFSLLIHWGWDEMAAISQRTPWSAFSWMKIYELRLKYLWILFPGAQVTIFQHWFGAKQMEWLLYWCIYASLGLNELTPCSFLAIWWCVIMWHFSYKHSLKTVLSLHVFCAMLGIIMFWYESILPILLPNTSLAPSIPKVPHRQHRNEWIT